MIDKIKSYALQRIMTYLNSHARLKAFVKRVVYGNRVLEKIVFGVFKTDSKKSQNSGLCGKRAKRVYMELKRGLE